MGFSSQEYWSGLPFPAPGDLPCPGTKPASLESPALAGGWILYHCAPPGRPTVSDVETNYQQESQPRGQDGFVFFNLNGHLDDT